MSSVQDKQAELEQILAVNKGLRDELEALEAVMMKISEAKQAQKRLVFLLSRARARYDRESETDSDSD
jgi:prefoldin subunit 5